MRKRRVLLLAILLLAIGFGAINTTLIITGLIRTGLNTEDWDVYFSYAQITKNDVLAGNATISDDGKTVTFTSDQLSLIGDTTILNYKVMNNSTQYDADVSITCEYESKDYLSVLTELNGHSTPAADTINAQSEKSGKIRVELTKSVAEDTSDEIVCNIAVTPVGRDEPAVITPKPIQLINEITKNGVAEPGEMITIGTERFYVISNNSSTIRAIAEWNLDVGNSTNSSHLANEETNLQSSRARGYYREGGVDKSYATVRFAKAKHWENNTTIELNHSNNNMYSYLTRYKEILESYQVNIQDVTLITKEELITLGCPNSGGTCTSVPSWLYQTTYWTRSADSDDYVWGIVTDGTLHRYNFVSNDPGVRPVIVFSESEL